MYATKEAFIAREHDNTIEPTIFYIDMRAFGKNFDDYITRAEAHRVRLVRAMVSRIFEDPVSGDLELRYVDSEGTRHRETFEMVVLSVGIQVPQTVRDLAGRLDIRLDGYGFVATDGYRPLATSRPGIFVSGAVAGPKDIPETVCEASAAAEAASAPLSSARGSLITPEVLSQCHRVFYRPGNMALVLSGCLDPEEVSRIVHDCAARYCGSISAEHGVGQYKRDEILRYKSPLEMELMRRIKSRPKPNRNP